MSENTASTGADFPGSCADSKVVGGSGGYLGSIHLPGLSTTTTPLPPGIYSILNIESGRERE